MAEPIELETLEVKPGGTLAGRTIQMRWPSVRFLITQRREGLLTNEALWEEIVDAIVSHDLDREPERLPARQIVAIGNAWLQALKDHAVPPPPGSSSEQP